MEQIFEYKDRKWVTKRDENIRKNEHCKFCEFKEYCDEYILQNFWFPCGCVFHSDNAYVIEKK